MKKLLLRIFLFLIVASICFVFVFTYKIFSEGNKIFSSNDNQSILKQFEQLIFNPINELKGENNNRINILLLGIGGENHNGGSLTDTIMILSIKPFEKEAALLSIPRDLYVNIPETNMNTKINAIKSYGDKKNNNGISLLKSVIKEISDLDIHYFVQLDFQGFIKIIDDLGGIDVYLENDIIDPSYPNFTNGYDPFYISSGWHHLDGQTALKVARSRHSKMGDFDRIQRQQKIIKVTKQKIFEQYTNFDIFAFNNILSSLSENMITDIQLQEIPRFYTIARDTKNNNITADVIDTKKYLNRTYVGMGYTLESKDKDYTKIKNLSSNIFDFEIPDKQLELIKEENGKIEIQNGTGTLDLANKVSKDLEGLGLQIMNSKNIPPPDFTGVKIIDNSNDFKENTLQLLKNKFEAIIDKPNSASPPKADFIIILGSGY
ncbi:LCP family protein [Patescibacteria group bacterium]|nr:LCP family protein [Patescibacteria group bacterium]